LIAYTISLILLFGSFILVYIVANFSATISATYPASINCKTIVNDYGTDLQEYAVEDYLYIDDEANKGKKSSGTLQCFC